MTTASDNGVDDAIIEFLTTTRVVAAIDAAVS
jgi:hypothetical protein